MNFEEMVRLLALDTDISIDKHLFGSLVSDGSLIVIGAVGGLAILAAIVIYLRKKKNKNDKDNEEE